MVRCRPIRVYCRRSKIRNLDSGLARLRADLADGTWSRRHGSLLDLRETDVGYRLVVAPPA